MTPDPLELWQSFRTVFFKLFKQIDPAALREAWQSSETRTQMYRKFIKAVADELQLQLEPEFLSVDFVLKSREHDVPYIAIESENNIWTADQEIKKLCSVAAPLRVLITVAYWNSTLGRQSRPSEKDTYLPIWNKEICKRISSLEPSGLRGGGGGRAG